MNREEVAYSLQTMLGQLWILGTAVRDLGEEVAAKHLDEATKYVRAAGAIFESPLERVKEASPPHDPFDPLGLADGVRRDVERLRGLRP